MGSINNQQSQFNNQVPSSQQFQQNQYNQQPQYNGQLQYNGQQPPQYNGQIYGQPQFNPPQQLQQQPTGYPNFPQIPLIPGLEYAKIKSFDGSICDCFKHLPSCCMAFWCPCCLAGQIGQKIKYFPYSTIVASYVIGLIITAFIIPGSTQLVCFYLSLIGFMIRRKVRELLYIENSIENGNCCTDCLHAFLCSCCNFAQLARTVFGYKSDYDCKSDNDCFCCSSDGTPEWQKQPMTV
jgi:Cys-rich protein (TIGR01571 family)